MKSYQDAEQFTSKYYQDGEQFTKWNIVFKSNTLEDLRLFHETAERSCKLHKISAQMPTILQDDQLICLGPTTCMFF